MVLILMGVSGTGKTTIGKVLAADLGWTFVEADDFHPVADVVKMQSGVPLSDEDRQPWLQAVRERIDDACRQEEMVILACSALKLEYREYLERNSPECIRYVHLSGSEELIRRRLQTRKGHFMGSNLLHSQFEVLEPPVNAIHVDISPAPEVIAAEIRRKLNL